MSNSAGVVVDELRQACAGMQTLVDGVRPAQWGAPTPCSEWDARALLNHVVFGNRSFTSILHGDPAPPQEQIRTMRDRDYLGDDPAAAWRDSADGLLAAFTGPEVLGREFRSPLGPLPGAGLARLRITETLVHGWDLARATGQSAPFPQEIVEATLSFTRRQLSDGSVRSALPFAAEQPAAADAPPLDQLAALLGRAVG
ncbi:TIGR03086 family metal-binding protein [Nakamurella multipartita]|jgi:uncharacterized protein (TIGR03086 family)|uniref:Mycothiol-dependent maleylpyruvate isomerase metal-binding domain-containing protein n=1 Tax=Nakamurella multipartita (strain ATCC 700099 / DSM 44233 / CIP 104796 / JCM 9543 / NBRC 105858 / Y-104) TaxID=479431 RepID=C8X9G7_NAKMY|nr:TIGR03086 family metal-binding protein [Nakamurella multipartita]ACV77235.1 hypothetical protein Namu_0824 [Nakamurella multipartita DSM 44233]